MNWSDRAQAYRDAVEQREGPDLDLLAEWVGGTTVLDVATGGGHVARRLRAEGYDVVTSDPAPGMEPDVVARAEDLPFDDESFDVVVTRIAPHHFEDVQRALREMARVARTLVLVEDTLYTDERVEEAEKLRDPTHVRSYTEEEWRRLFAGAALDVEAVDQVEKRHPFDDWLARTGCDGEDAERVRELLAHRTEGDVWIDTKILLKGRK
jgi:ubiquinone/menaquinone biosynthesis C-methylase UbiE